MWPNIKPMKNNFSNSNETRPGTDILPASRLQEPNQPQPLTPADKFRPAHIHRLMGRAGFQPLHAPESVMAVAAARRNFHSSALPQVGAFFLARACMVPEGLAELPECWLRALPSILWSLKKPHWNRLPFFIRRLREEDGVLLVQFAQELPEPTSRITAWDRIRVALNASLYPNRWRPLKHHDFFRLPNPCLQPRK